MATLYTRLQHHLGEERFVRFLEHLVGDGGHPQSARHLLDRIVELGSVKDALDEAERETGFLSTVLTINPRGSSRFRIRFGEEGDGVGDGGEWTVLFFKDHRVRRVDAHSFWRC